MKTFLLPNSYKKIGWVLLVPSFILGILIMVVNDLPFDPKIKTFGLFGAELFNGQAQPPFRIGEIQLIPNLVSLLFLVGGLLVMFSKEKKEDEFIDQIRLRALQSAVFINYVLLFCCILLIHGIPFFHVMIYNLFTVIIIYIIRFQYLIRHNSIHTNE